MEVAIIIGGIWIGKYHLGLLKFDVGHSNELRVLSVGYPINVGNCSERRSLLGFRRFKWIGSTRYTMEVDLLFFNFNFGAKRPLPSETLFV
ncbi:hypothetical protein [Larkinella soli]|uniref:hypothetical protein n=1 Tax=Larkinella soli TaxID=1770527 RepID=UPI000FFC5FC9|nr:hypothetical protein [Larkinella soli]